MSEIVNQTPTIHAPANKALASSGGYAADELQRRWLYVQDQMRCAEIAHKDKEYGCMEGCMERANRELVKCIHDAKLLRQHID